MLFWKIWKYNALYTQENNNVLSINRLICSYYICCLRDLFKKKNKKTPKQNRTKKPSLFTKFHKRVLTLMVSFLFPIPDNPFLKPHNTVLQLFGKWNKYVNTEKVYK